MFKSNEIQIIKKIDHLEHFLHESKWRNPHASAHHRYHPAESTRYRHTASVRAQQKASFIDAAGPGKTSLPYKKTLLCQRR
jgi:hypothetical protein